MQAINKFVSYLTLLEITCYNKRYEMRPDILISVITLYVTGARVHNNPLLQYHVSHWFLK